MSENIYLNKKNIRQKKLNIKKNIYNKLKSIFDIFINPKKQKIKNKIYKFIVIFIIIICISFKKIIFVNGSAIKKLNNKERNLKVCLCVIGKKENLYVKEYIEHYKKIGYNHIFIYDNNDINDEKFEDIIQKDIICGFVTIINYRGYILDQTNAYKDCYEKNNRDYDWLSFFDFDEFLEFNNKNQTIQTFLSSKRYVNCQNIKINWLIYKNNNSLYYNNNTLQKRLTIPLYKDGANIHIKSTVRGNLSENYWSKRANPHTSLTNFTSCNSLGKKINYDSPYNIPPNFNYAYLKHYYYKSFEEFCLKIYRRVTNDKNNIFNKILLNLFEKNKNNKEKLKIMKKIFKIK